MRQQAKVYEQYSQNHKGLLCLAGSGLERSKRGKLAQVRSMGEERREGRKVACTTSLYRMSGVERTTQEGEGMREKRKGREQLN
jgi:hypothetical protein